MEMSANENETVDVDIRLYATVRSNSIVFEERNRMERPSRVFSSHHHLSMPPVLTETNNMEQNEQTRLINFPEMLRSSHSATSHSNISNTSSTRSGGNTRNMDVTRPRFRSTFTITDSGFQQTTAAGQISFSTTPPHTNQSSTLMTNTEAVDTNTESDDEPSGNLSLNFSQTRNFADRFNGLLVNGPMPARNLISGRGSRRFTELPYVLRNNSNNSPSNGRIHNRHVRFSTTHQYNDTSVDRSITPDQERPEVVGDDMVLTNQEYEEVYQESISSVSSNDVDSGDFRAVEEDNIIILDGSNELPRTRVEPLILTPVHISPDTSIDSLSYTTDSPITNANNNNLPDVPPGIPLAYYTDNYQSTSPTQDLEEPASLPMTYNEDNQSTPIRNLGPRNTNEPILSHNEERPKTYEELNDQLAQLFECPVCFEHINPPVYQCIVGHLICAKCANMCGNCPTCRNPFCSKRNLYMEKVSNLVKFPCKNAFTGCKLQLFTGQKEIHERDCCYEHYQCFHNNCTWKGYLPEILMHMNYKHSRFMQHGPVQMFDILLLNNNNSLFWFLSAHSEFFAIIVHWFNLPKRIKIQVYYIGPAAKAKQFKYTVTLSQHKHQNDINQRLIYERLTLPYSDIHEISNSNGPRNDTFSMPGDVLMPFTKQGRSLPFTIKVEPNS